MRAALDRPIYGRRRLWLVAALPPVALLIWLAAWLLDQRETLHRRVEIQRRGGLVEVEQTHRPWFAGLLDPRYFEHVVHVNLSGLEDYDLRRLSVFTELESLVLYNFPLTEDDLERLAGFTRLKELNLLYSSVHGQKLSYLARLPSLTDLRLSPVDDDDLPYLAGCEKLQALRIYRSAKLTDQGLQRLPHLPRLTLLHLVETGTTSAGVEALRKRFPSLEEVVHQ